MLRHAGASLGLSDFGIYAMESMRLEKSHLSWKGNIATKFAPTETGVSRFVSLQKPDVMGRVALLERSTAKPSSPCDDGHEPYGY
jgi:dimethylglycine dehydrogenase